MTPVHPGPQFMLLSVVCLWPSGATPIGGEERSVAPPVLPSGTRTMFGFLRDSKKTFKPPKQHKKGTKQAELHSYAQLTLGRWGRGGAVTVVGEGIRLTFPPPLRTRVWAGAAARIAFGTVWLMLLRRCAQRGHAGCGRIARG